MIQVMIVAVTSLVDYAVLRRAKAAGRTVCGTRTARRRP